MEHMPKDFLAMKIFIRIRFKQPHTIQHNIQAASHYSCSLIQEKWEHSLRSHHKGRTTVDPQLLIRRGQSDNFGDGCFRVRT